MPWYRGRGAELSEAPRDHDRQARVCRACPCARGRCAGSAEPDRTGVKDLVLREASFRRAVPTKARFVDDRRSDYIHIGQRDKLNARRRDRVEARKLAAGGRQCQGKSLRAIAEEIPPGQDMVLVKVVVDLTNQSPKFVE